MQSVVAVYCSVVLWCVAVYYSAPEDRVCAEPMCCSVLLQYVVLCCCSMWQCVAMPLGIDYALSPCDAECCCSTL